MATRDEQLIQRMLAYCDEILGTLDYFGRDEQRFDTDYIMRNALAMPLHRSANWRRMRRIPSSPPIRKSRGSRSRACARGLPISIGT